MVAIRFIGPGQARGVITLDDGREVWTVLPPEDGEMLAVYDRFRAGGGVIAAAAPAPAVPPDCASLPYWRMALRLWGRPDGQGGTLARFDDVDAAIRKLEAAAGPDGSPLVVTRRLGMLAREQFEYANGATRADLLRMAPAFGFTAADCDESLWRADRVRQGDLSGTWPPPPS